MDGEPWAEQPENKRPFGSMRGAFSDSSIALPEPSPTSATGAEGTAGSGTGCSKTTSVQSPCEGSVERISNPVWLTFTATFCAEDGPAFETVITIVKVSPRPGAPGELVERERSATGFGSAESDALPFPGTGSVSLPAAEKVTSPTAFASGIKVMLNCFVDPEAIAPRLQLTIPAPDVHIPVDDE